MQHWSAIEEVPAGFGPSVVTLGNFDGVHQGHQAVLKRVVDEAHSRDAAAVAVTFTPHPVAVLHPERAPAQLIGDDRRLELLAELGLDATLVITFTREFAQLTPAQFVEQVFVQTLGASTVVVGTDTRFGLGNSGDIDTMRELGQQLGFDVVALAPVGQQDAERRHWSSSRVRAALLDGDVETAAEVLGRAHRVTGEVVHGHHRGRELGFPTANLGGAITGMVPADGVYAGWLERFDLASADPQRRLPAAISVGTNPTFDDVAVRSVEAHVLDRTDLDLYDEQVGVDFVGRLRGNERFESIEELVQHITADVHAARAVLAG